MLRFSKYLIIGALIIGLAIFGSVSCYRLYANACKCSCEECTCSITKSSRDECLCGCEDCN